MNNSVDEEIENVDDDNIGDEVEVDDEVDDKDDESNICWKNLTGFEENYEISSNGTIRNKKTGKVRKQYEISKGRLTVGFHKGKKHTQKIL